MVITSPVESPLSLVNEGFWPKQTMSDVPTLLGTSSDINMSGKVNVHVLNEHELLLVPQTSVAVMGPYGNFI